MLICRWWVRSGAIDLRPTVTGRQLQTSCNKSFLECGTSRTKRHLEPLNGPACCFSHYQVCQTIPQRKARCILSTRWGPGRALVHPSHPTSLRQGAGRATPSPGDPHQSAQRSPRENPNQAAQATSAPSLVWGREEEVQSRPTPGQAPPSLGFPCKEEKGQSDPSPSLRRPSLAPSP